MTWLGNNWIWIVFAFGMFAMHFFGHRHGHGSAHGNRHDHGRTVPADRLSRQTESEVPSASPTAHAAANDGEARTTEGRRHRHRC